MSEAQTEASVQADWILPPSCNAAGVTNAVALAVTTSPVVIDLTSIPCAPSFYDRSVAALKPNPLGRYICFQAQGCDLYGIFGPNVASLTTGAVSSAVITSGGSGYQSAPTVTVGGSGSAATATATISNGVVNTVTITAYGSGYTGTPALTFTGGSALGAATGTITVGTSPSAASVNAVSAGGVVVMSPGVTFWIPQGQTGSFKLPAGTPSEPWGTNSEWRAFGFLTGGGSGTVRVWQSSP